MSIEGCIVTYTISYGIVTIKQPPFSTSGIKFKKNWVLTHASLFSELTAAKDVLESQKTYPVLIKRKRIYKTLPEVLVTYADENNGKDYTTINDLPNLVTKSGKIVFMWKCPKLWDTLNRLFSNWTFEKDEKSDDTDKLFMASFALIHVGEFSVTVHDIQNALTDLFEVCDKQIPMRGHEICLESTPFGSEVFLNSKSFGVICNCVGDDNRLMLCDGSTAPRSEGGPVFLKEKNEIMGMIISSISWWRGEWVGLSLVAHLALCLYQLKTIQNKNFPYRISASPKNILIANILSVIDSTVVLVRCGSSWGSGISLGGGNILTCSHVVKNYEDSGVNIFQKGKFVPATVMTATKNDKAYDLAVIHGNFVDTPPAVKMANHPSINGENIVAVGFPYFNENDVEEIRPTITKGHITKVTPFMIQTSACVQSGFSGGAIMRICKNTTDGNVSCELLGIIVCNAKNEEKNVVYPFLNMAIPIEAVKDALQNIVDRGTLSSVNFEEKNKDIQSFWELKYPDKNIKHVPKATNHFSKYSKL